MKSLLFLSIFALACAMYVTGALWPKPVNSTWTNDKAIRLVEVNERLAQLSVLLAEPVNMHSGPDRGVAQAEVMRLLEEKESLQAAFDDAIKRRPKQSALLQGAGILIAVVGVAIWCAMTLRELRTTDPAEQ
jgi:hypothetical protein